MNFIRRAAIALLRSELEQRENAARTLAAGAYQEGQGSGGKRGRAWWDGYAHGVRAIREHGGVL